MKAEIVHDPEPQKPEFEPLKIELLITDRAEFDALLRTCAVSDAVLRKNGNATATPFSREREDRDYYAVTMPLLIALTDEAIRRGFDK